MFFYLAAGASVVGVTTGNATTTCTNMRSRHCQQLHLRKTPWQQVLKMQTGLEKQRRWTREEETSAGKC